jgi:hypothetical protein
MMLRLFARLPSRSFSSSSIPAKELKKWQKLAHWQKLAWESREKLREIEKEYYEEKIGGLQEDVLRLCNNFNLRGALGKSSFQVSPCVIKAFIVIQSTHWASIRQLTRSRKRTIQTSSNISSKMLITKLVS